MPQFNFLSVDQMEALVAFTQSRGGKAADIRNQHQVDMKALMEANGAERVREPDNFPAPGEVVRFGLIERGYWFEDNPLELTQEDLIRGRQIFEQNCIACHGSNGDGEGPGAPFLNPGPPGFTSAAFEQTGAGSSPGAYYWRILRGVPGTAMENFGTRLSVEDIWRTVLFLKTIANGGLTADVPTVDMYIQWEGNPETFEWANCFLTEEEAFTFATPGIATPNPTQALETATATAEGTPGIETPTPTPGEATPTLTPGLSPPEGVGGDVPGIVALGQVNPVYALSLWMIENDAVPCATTGFEQTTWNDIMNWAAGGPDGFARQGTPQVQFIPPDLLNESTLPPNSLESVWE
jgi:mono/diheme cytochrome c family protein